MTDSAMPKNNPPTANSRLIAWVEEIAELTQPDAVEWCDGSQEEYDRMFEIMLSTGTAERLNEANRPNSYLVQSDPADVARDHWHPRRARLQDRQRRVLHPDGRDDEHVCLRHHARSVERREAA